MGVTDRIVNELIADVKSSVPEKEGGQVFYPGELELRTRNENLKEGIPVLPEVWERILKM